MINRLCTALVALLVVVGFALPVSAAPIEAQPEAGFSLRVAKLVDTILASLAAVLPTPSRGTTEKNNGGNPIEPVPPDGGFERMMMGLEPNG